jgi:hypothetical protein
VEVIIVQPDVDEKTFYAKDMPALLHVHPRYILLLQIPDLGSPPPCPLSRGGQLPRLVMVDIKLLLTAISSHNG